MKRTLFLLVFNISLITSLFAQLKSPKLADDKQVLVVAIPDTSNGRIFDKNPKLKSIAIIYKDNQPYYVMLDFKNNGHDYDRYEHYDLAFEGDAYLFKWKYNLSHYIEPLIYLRNASGRDTSSAFIESSISIFKDTVLCYFKQTRPGMDVKPSNPEGIVGMPARYKGSLELIETKLAKELSEMKNKMGIDSIVVFRATVSKQGVLSAIELIAGKQSLLSNLVQQAFMPKKDEFGLLPPSADWFAAGIDRGAIETKIRIYARLNPDGSVTIKTPRRLRTFTGE